MKKFAFSLASLLVLRERDEQNARAALSEANAKMAAIDEQIMGLESTLTGTFGSWDGGKSRTFSPMDRIGLSNRITELERQAEEAWNQKKAAEQKRVRAIEALQEASRNRKIVSNLKEKRFREYSAETFKQEAQEIEDIFNARRSAI